MLGEARKVDKRTFSRATLLTLCALVVCEQFMVEMLFPFAAFMVRDFNIAPAGEEGYWVGILSSSFGVAQLLSGYPWAALSDRHGRRGFLVLGAICNAGSMVALGWSGNYWYAVGAHAAGGLLSGNSGIVRACVGDLLREGMPASLVWGMWGMAFGLGRVAATASGAFLANPAQHGWVASDSLFGRKPYLLPCVVAAGLCLLCALAAVTVLEETLPPEERSKEARRRRASSSLSGPLLSSDASSGLLPARAELSSASLNVSMADDGDSDGGNPHGRGGACCGLLAWGNAATIPLVACNFWEWVSFNVNDEVFMLYSKEPVSEGGLGFTSHQAGYYFLFFGAGIIFNQKVVWPYLMDKLKVPELNLFRVCIFGMGVVFALVPMANVAAEKSGMTLMWVVLLGNISLHMIFGNAGANGACIALCTQRSRG